MKKYLAILLVGCLFLFGACSDNSANRNPASGNIGAEPEQQELPSNNGGTTAVGQAAASDPAVLEEGNDEPLHNAIEIPVYDGDVIEIKENIFIAQTNDIYLNSEDYLGKTIKYEGMIASAYWEPTDSNYYYVVRYGPGCCGNDDNAGFEISWDGDIPKDKEWVEVTGVLDSYTEGGWTYLILRVTSLEVKEERGAEYVFV